METKKKMKKERELLKEEDFSMVIIYLNLKS